MGIAFHETAGVPCSFSYPTEAGTSGDASQPTVAEIDGEANTSAVSGDPTEPPQDPQLNLGALDDPNAHFSEDET